MLYRKYRKCPYCKSNKGFKYSYIINGEGTEGRDFKGNVLCAERSTNDRIESYSVRCANCEKQLDKEKLNFDSNLIKNGTVTTVI